MTQALSTDIAVEDLLMVITTISYANGRPSFSQASEHSIRQYVVDHGFNPPQLLEGRQADGTTVFNEVYRFTPAYDAAGQPVVYMVAHEEGLPLTRQCYSLEEFEHFRAALRDGLYLEKSEPRNDARWFPSTAPALVQSAPFHGPHILASIAATFAGLNV